MSQVSEKIGRPLARRIALAAQGFSRPRPEQPSRRQIDQMIARLGLLQIDSVNVLTRMHYLPLFSRLGDYPRTLLEEAAWGARPKRKLFEYWAHEASLLPLSTQPLLRWRMERAERGEGTWGPHDSPSPSSAGLKPKPCSSASRLKDPWRSPISTMQGGPAVGGDGAMRKTALEWLFWSGRITTKTRRANFERVYDLTERVLPEATLTSPTPSPADAHRALVAIAAKALGVATVKDLRDYFRLSPEDVKPCIPQLVESGELLQSAGGRLAASRLRAR